MRSRRPTGNLGARGRCDAGCGHPARFVVTSDESEEAIATCAVHLAHFIDHRLTQSRLVKIEVSR